MEPKKTKNQRKTGEKNRKDHRGAELGLMNAFIKPSRRREMEL